MTDKKTNKRILSEAHEMMLDLKEVGLIDLAAMKEFEVLYLSEVQQLSASKIKKIRQATGVSQPVLARLINVSPSAVKQWERGERKPSGPSLKLLNLIDQKGIDAIL